MTNYIRRLVSIIWLWNLCVGEILVDNRPISFESTTESEGLTVPAQECGNDDPRNQAVLKLEINCDENISITKNDINALRESIKKEVYAITQSLQTCSSDVISDMEKLLRKDECAGPNNCSANAECIDGVLSYRCNCRPGYQGDGFTCSDMDECSTGTHKCHSRAKCANTIGSYTCRCRPPYSGNGYTCFNIACRSPAKMIEGLGCVIPVTENVIWPKARDHCHQLGYRLLEGIKDTDQLVQLREHFDQGVFAFPHPYHDVWLGMKDNEWVEEPNTQVPPHLWNPGQPDVGPGGCGYVALQTSPPTFWDTSCTARLMPFFCQALLA